MAISPALPLGSTLAAIARGNPAGFRTDTFWENE